MLVVISPAKRLNPAPAALPEGVVATRPAYAAYAARLASIARKLTAPDLQALMSISPALAELNRARFHAFRRDPAPETTRPAALLFDGDTYAGLAAASLSPDALRWAQDHLRILSGLYGLLRPLDLIQPYRLEMGSRLATPKGANLYDWWGNRLSQALNLQAKATGASVLVNCASAEYFGAVDLASLRLRVVTPVFLDGEGDEARIISFHAKKARGAMARFIVEHRLNDPAELAAFQTGGYRHDADRSTDDRPVFLRARD